MRQGIEKTAVVTGAASGLGRSLCVELARDGWKLGMVDINIAGAEETLALVERAGGTGEPYICDVRSFEEVQAMADHFLGAWGKVGMLFNNAGLGAGGNVGEIPIEEWRRTVDTDLWGVIHGCHAFIPAMKRARAGHIVNTGSIGAFIGLPEIAPYSVSKAGVIALSETIRSELAPFNVGVTVVCPSFFKTNIIDTMATTDDWHRQVLEVAFESAKMSCDELACRVLRAAEKNRLYVFPQASAKLTWYQKRFVPTTTIRLWTFLNGRGWLRPFVERSVRGGW